jgi:hypothetical protein
MVNEVRRFFGDLGWRERFWRGTNKEEGREEESSKQLKKVECQ